MTRKFTQEEMKVARANASEMLEARRARRERIRSNSLEEWGNEKCISRTSDFVVYVSRDISGETTDATSDRQISYWLKKG